MFVENQAGNLEVTNFTIENSSFTHDIDTFDLVNIFHNFSEKGVGSKAERIVDIKNKSGGLSQFFGPGNFETCFGQPFG